MADNRNNNREPSPRSASLLSRVFERVHDATDSAKHKVESILDHNTQVLRDVERAEQIGSTQPLHPLTEARHTESVDPSRDLARQVQEDRTLGMHWHPSTGVTTALQDTSLPADVSHPTRPERTADRYSTEIDPNISALDSDTHARRYEPNLAAPSASASASASVPAARHGDVVVEERYPSTKSHVEPSSYRYASSSTVPASDYSSLDPTMPPTLNPPHPGSTVSTHDTVEENRRRLQDLNLGRSSDRDSSRESTLLDRPAASVSDARRASEHAASEAHSKVESLASAASSSLSNITSSLSSSLSSLSERVHSALESTHNRAQPDPEIDTLRERNLDERLEERMARINREAEEEILRAHDARRLSESATHHSDASLASSSPPSVAPTAHQAPKGSGSDSTWVYNVGGPVGSSYTAPNVVSGPAGTHTISGSSTQSGTGSSERNVRP